MNTVKYVASTVSLNERATATQSAVAVSFDVRTVTALGTATHQAMISADLLNLLLSDDAEQASATLAMLRDMRMQQLDEQFYDDEGDNMQHCIPE
jgi:hypothetical protein